MPLPLPETGPDYQNGWGLLNTRRALDIVHAGAGDNLGVIEATLLDGETHEYYFANTTGADIRATIVWTDPPGTVGPAAVDVTTSKLVNDLDLVLLDVGGGVTVDPWILNRALPGNGATRGANHVDNVEQVDLAAAALGVYRVSVSHTGSLTGGAQDYALVWRGMHDSPSPVIGGSRPPSFWLGDPRPNPVAGTATVEFGLEAPGTVAIHVYDVAGHRVATLLEPTTRGIGTDTVVFDGSGLASGIYFLRMESGAQTTTRKITIIK
jgi:hypothetical protein